MKTTAPQSLGDIDVEPEGAGKVRETYQSIEAHRCRFPVEVMCKVLGVAPSEYYDWLKHSIEARTRRPAPPKNLRATSSTLESAALCGLRQLMAHASIA